MGSALCGRLNLLQAADMTPEPEMPPIMLDLCGFRSIGMAPSHVSSRCAIG
ncbi:hypothetical protein SAMN05519104_1685 [Rhizobiales bacterium GAS188]|nr:hypothetical protein SAMN05519104_1685 [Rhizobiales bacterium GAS188]